jgi:hypothetical protein
MQAALFGSCNSDGGPELALAAAEEGPRIEANRASHPARPAPSHAARLAPHLRSTSRAARPAAAPAPADRREARGLGGGAARQGRLVPGQLRGLARARAASKRIVFLDFYSRTSPFTKKLEKITYVDGRVVSALGDMLCFSIDADGKDSKPLRKRFQVQSAPALVFLDPDGTLRDQLSGYVAPDPFLNELARIKANKDTFSDLRARMRKDEDDLTRAGTLACKLKRIGDLVGYEEQVAAISERDRDGHSLASRRMQLARCTRRPRPARHRAAVRLRARREGSGPPVRGWWSIWMLEGQAARSEREPEKTRIHELRYFAAARALWPLVPAEQYGMVGNNIAWSFYENRAARDALRPRVRAGRGGQGGRGRARRAGRGRHPGLLPVRGREAGRGVVQVKRCIDLDPQNPTWRERLGEFTAPH